MVSEDDWKLTAFVISFGILTALILITIIALPFLVKYCRSRRKNTSQSVEESEELLNRNDEEDGLICRTKKTGVRRTELGCTVEYRARGSQLIVGVANVVPAPNAWKFKKEATKSRIFLLVCIDGDYQNSPCESKKHELKRNVYFNEIFIFTVMPYDLSSFTLVLQIVLVCGMKRYGIGTLIFPLTQLERNSSSVKSVYQLQFPEDQSPVQKCLLSLSIMKCENTIKLKVVKLFFLDPSPVEKPISGIHIRAQITDFQNPLQCFETTKKRCQSCITFNESVTFQFEMTINNSIELEIQLLESNDLAEERVEQVRGRYVLYVGKEENIDTVLSRNDNHLIEVINNPNVEVIRWHPIPFNRSQREL